MNYTLGEAAKATGKSKSTIHRAIKNGRISGKKLKGGAYSIDPSELHRVFPMISNATVAQQSERNSTQPIGETPELEGKVAMLEALLDREKEITEDLRQERDAWKNQATALLTDQRPNRRWWWQK